MTSNITPFEGRYAALTIRERLDNEWDAAAGAVLREGAAWLWEPDEIPGWVVASWATFVDAIRGKHPAFACAAKVGWSAAWSTFVDGYLAGTEEWQRRVGMSLDEPHIEGRSV